MDQTLCRCHSRDFTTAEVALLRNPMASQPTLNRKAP